MGMLTVELTKMIGPLEELASIDMTDLKVVLDAFNDDSKTLATDFQYSLLKFSDKIAFYM